MEWSNPDKSLSMQVLLAPVKNYKKGQSRTEKWEGYDWPLSKGRADRAAGARMYGMLPDSG